MSAAFVPFACYNPAICVLVVCGVIVLTVGFIRLLRSSGRARCGRRWCWEAAVVYRRPSTPPRQIFLLFFACDSRACAHGRGTSSSPPRCRSSAGIWNRSGLHGDDSPTGAAGISAMAGAVCVASPILTADNDDAVGGICRSCAAAGGKPPFRFGDSGNSIAVFRGQERAVVRDRMHDYDALLCPSSIH